MILMLMISAAMLISCGDDDAMESNTIFDIASNDSQFSTLVSALERTGLDATLMSNGTFTVFAPTNAAFNSLGVDLNTLSDQQLSDILLYHVLGATVNSSDIASGQTYVSTASQSGPDNAQLTMLIENNGGVSINGNSNVVAADVTADNGVIHIVDAVLLPLDIVGHAAANSNFSQLVGALSSAPGDLVSVLSGDGPFTVFAPVNSAFEAISATVATLTADQLASVLTYHVIGSANVASTALSNGAEVQTVNGQNVTVSLDNGPQLIDAAQGISNIIVTDVQATNGIVHAIDAVLIPSL